MKRLYYFNNHSMVDDVVDDKGKVLCYKQIAVIATTELEARRLAHRPKIDKTDVLDPEWELNNTFNLGRDWIV